MLPYRIGLELANKKTNAVMGHDHAHTGNANARRLTIALGLTGAFLFAEIVGGILTGSLALLSDAAHMFTDVMALVIALLAIRIGSRPADLKRTYGYRRFEILAAALNATILFMVALYILYEAYQRFRTPLPIATGGMLAIAVLGLVVNLISMRILRGSGDSLNMRAAYMEVFSDMLGSLAVIVAAIFIRLTGWGWIDPILAVLIGLWVLPRTWRLLSESVNILLEGVPKGLEMQTLLNDLAALPDVTGVHDLHVWAVTSGQNSLTAHLVVQRMPADSALLMEARAVAKAHGIEHTSFQIEVEPCGPEDAWCALQPTEHHHDH